MGNFASSLQWALLGATLGLVGISHARAEQRIPLPRLTDCERFLIPKFADDYIEDGQTWKKAYEAFYAYAKAHSKEFKAVFPDDFNLLPDIHRAMGQLPPALRARMVEHMMREPYEQYRRTLEALKESTEELNRAIKTARKGTPNEKVFEAWIIAQAAEQKVSTSEENYLYHLSVLRKKLGPHGKEALNVYKIFPIFPPFDTKAWHLSAPMVEHMLLMSMQGLSEWSFSKHALEQANLRGFSEDLVRTGLRNGHITVIEASTIRDREEKRSDATSIRYKFLLNGFVHEGRPKQISIIAKFEKTPDSAKPFRTEIITVGNQNQWDRYRDGLFEMVKRERIQFKGKQKENVALLQLFRRQARTFFHDLTRYSLTNTEAEEALMRLHSDMGFALGYTGKNAIAVVTYTLRFMEAEMPKAKVQEPIKKAFQRLYNYSL